MSKHKKKNKKNNKVESAFFGKHATKGVSPALALIDPKYAYNVAAIIRAASCYGVEQVWFTGKRVNLDPTKGERLPREERMRGYQSVDLINFDHIFEQFDRKVTPVAIELNDSAEQLPTFEHPENPLYVFGPEDGGLPKMVLKHCHRFVVIPTKHCLNLSSAVYTVLYDRYVKRLALGLEEYSPMANVLQEDRVWTNFEDRDTMTAMVTQ